MTTFGSVDVFLVVFFYPLFTPGGGLQPVLGPGTELHPAGGSVLRPAGVFKLQL